MTKTRFWTACMTLFCAALFSAARADTVTITASADNTIYSESGQLSDALGDGIFAGTTGVGNVRRALLRFDLSAIPPGSTITGVSLNLYLSRTRAGSVPVTLHRLNASWGEGTSIAPGQGGGGGPATSGDATWTHRFAGGAEWTTPGGDFLATPSATTNVGAQGNTFTWSSATLVADTQMFLDMPSMNHGWIVRAPEFGDTSAKRFDSRETSTSSRRPRLIVTFTPAGAPTGACCVGTSCSVVTQAQCTTLGGTWQGSGVPCSPSPCGIANIGACCLTSGSCVSVTQTQCTSQGGTYRGNGTSCGTANCPVVLTPFVDALPIPGIMQPVTGMPGGTAHYDISMTEFTQQLHRDLPPTTVWGYDGTFPAKTIEAREGRPVTVTWRNNLRTPLGELRTTHYLPVDLCLHGPNMFGSVPRTTVHLHGGHVSSASDGQPDDAYPPGQSAPLYVYPNTQPASTLWYHDHALGITRLNVYMGLAGFYLLRDAQEDALNIPRGEYEIPLAIQDRSFNPDGSLRYHDMWHEHFFGDSILVNGKVTPFLNVKRGKYRFRILNGCNSRTLQLLLSNGHTFWQIGSDTGLLPAPVAMNSLTIQPGERADVVMDFGIYGPGVQIILVNQAPAPYPGTAGVGVVPNVMRFNVQSMQGHTAALPASLVPVPRIPEAQAVQHRSFSLAKEFDPGCGHDMWMINGMMWDDITEYPIFGTTEVWSWVNRSGVTHPMHMHLVSFQVLDRQNFTVIGGEVVPTGSRITPPANELGWKDTVQCPPNQITRVIARFDGFTGRFPYHCHMLEHEDHEMMRQFEVCIPANIPSPPPDVNSCFGGAAAFTISATGTNLSYQWYREGVPLVDGVGEHGSIVSGATTPTLNLSNLSYFDDGPYACRAFNGCGESIYGAYLRICVGDFNCSGGTPDDADVNEFFTAWNAGSPQADVNASGGTPDDADLTTFFERWNSGEC